MCPVAFLLCVAAAAAGGKAGKEAEEPRIDMLDIRVGKIVSVKQHPNAGTLGYYAPVNKPHECACCRAA